MYSVSSFGVPCARKTLKTGLRSAKDHSWGQFRGLEDLKTEGALRKMGLLILKTRRLIGLKDSFQLSTAGLWRRSSQSLLGGAQQMHKSKEV